MKSKRQMPKSIVPDKIADLLDPFAASSTDVIGEYIESKVKEYRSRIDLNTYALKEWISAELLKDGENVDADIIREITRRVLSKNRLKESGH
jgi:hypothetical protein